MDLVSEAAASLPLTKVIDPARIQSYTSDSDKKHVFKQNVLDYARITDKGSRLVHGDLMDHFPIGHPMNDLVPDKSTIERWIKKDKEDKPFDIEKAKEDEPQLYAYFKQLQLINTAVFSQDTQDSKQIPLTNLFVKHAKRCLYRFNDPLGKDVDLYAQWVVIREYYARDRVGNTFTKDLDAILDYTPWLDVGYDPTDTLYSAAFHKDTQNLTPRLSYAMAVGTGVMLDGASGKNPNPIFQFDTDQPNNSHMFGVYAHLRLPFHMVYIDKTKNQIFTQTIPPINSDRYKDFLKSGNKSHEELRKIPLAKSMIFNSL
jgi:hypothetical protein